MLVSSNFHHRVGVKIILNRLKLEKVEKNTAPVYVYILNTNINSFCKLSLNYDLVNQPVGFIFNIKLISKELYNCKLHESTHTTTEETHTFIYLLLLHISSFYEGK